METFAVLSKDTSEPTMRVFENASLTFQAGEKKGHPNNTK